MTFATVRGAAEEAAKRGKLTPHQLAALSALDQALTDAQRELFTEAWRAEGSPARLPEPAWLKPALKIIKEFEGLRLEAYRCPAGVPTIGYGATRMIDKPVRMGDKITAEFAEELLVNQVENLFAPGLFALLPMAKTWKPDQQAAILSWAFNIGLGAVEDSTLRRRLLAKEPPAVVVAEELPRWNKGDGGKVLEGLTRRRAAEVALFLGSATPPKATAGSVLLKVPYFLQHDNASGTGYRECASSSAAMVAAFWSKVATDDAYNKIRAKYGDTTDVSAQVDALRSLGLDARFRTDGTPAILEAELRAGRPVMVGWLHNGLVSAPSGGGHWSVVIGFDSARWAHNDPNGEADMVAGGYVNTTGGKGVKYSRKNWDRRWMVDGRGWMVLVQPLAT
jgi:GH24 family phage-related lysozyme (muramidase)